MLTATEHVILGVLRKFRRTTPFPLAILLPGLLILMALPMLKIWLDDDRTAFMTAFVLGYGLRVAMKSERFIQQSRSFLADKATILLALIVGPGVLALLILAGDPLLCQRYLSLYFLVAAMLYLIDIAVGTYKTTQSRWPQPQMRATDAAMTRALVAYNLAMFLANEVMIHHASQTTWLLYFGFLPLLSNILRSALVRSLTEGLIDAPAP